MATQEKLKKGFMSFYKSSIKNHKKKREPVVSQSLRLQKKLEDFQDVEPAVVSTDKPAVRLSQSHNSLQKKLENFQDIEPDVAPMIKPAAIKSPSHDSLQKKLETCQEIEPVVPLNKQTVLQSHGNLLLKRLENFEEIEQGGRRGAGNFVEARKSVSHIETNLASVISFLQIKVLVSDMPGFMQVHAFRCARRTYDSLEKFSSKHIAYNIKKVRL